MYRSFSDRVLGGVCGGLGALLSVNPWLLRLLFVLLSIVSFGALVLYYLILWLMVPQQNMALNQHSGPWMLLLAIALLLATVGGWFLWINGGLRGPAGEPVYWLSLLLAAAFVFFLRQLRGA
jgi:phage shock protein PspC (stress-responsive transcriptional regulator)